jgi:dipeptidyl aminopeptidase/acylaminoacyl peptidase
MHHLTYAADGSHLAYIFRDLAYDRSAGEYVPDSSLYVSDPQGQAATKLFGDARRVRHLTWAPEGATLAFDLRADDADRRQVVVYDAAQERTSYVVPPGAAASYDHVQPRWAPDASRVAFTRRSGTQQTAAVRAAGQTQGLGTTVAPVWGWADARHVVVPGPDSLRVTTVRGQTVHALPRGVNLIQAEMASGV